MKRSVLACLLVLCCGSSVYGQGVTIQPPFPLSAPLTAGSGTGLTVNQPGMLVRQVHKVTTTYAAFSAAALTADKTIATLPAKTRLCGVLADVTQTFSGGAVATATLQLGTTVAGAELLLAADVKTAVVTLGLLGADLGVSLATLVQGCTLPSWGSTTALSARIVTTVANSNVLTSGSVTWYFVTETLP